MNEEENDSRSDSDSSNSNSDADDEAEDDRTNEILEYIRDARNNDEKTELCLWRLHTRGPFTLEEAASTVDCLVDTPRLTSLCFEGLSFTDEAFNVLRDRLPSCSSVTRVVFNCALGNKGLKHLGPAFARMPITSLALFGGRIRGAASGEIIGNILAESGTLQDLNLHDNKGIGMLGIGQGLACERCILQELYLFYCGIGNDGMDSLLSAFGETTNKTNKSLTVLNLAENNIVGTVGGQNLRRLLEHFEGLQTLDLRSNPLGPDGGRELGFGLALPDLELKKLDLYCCRLGHQGVWQLVPQGETNKSVTSLHLDNNRIEGREGREALRAVLPRFVALQELGLCNNALGPDGAHEVVLGLQDMPPLLRLDIAECSLGDRGVQVLSEHIGAIKNLEQLWIYDNDITPAGLDSVINILGGCKKMNKLDMCGNEDIFKGRPARVRAFASALSQHKYLRELDIHDIVKNEWVQEALLDGIEENYILCDMETESEYREPNDPWIGFIRENFDRLKLVMERNRMLAKLDHDALGKEPTRSVVFLDALEEARCHEKGLTVIWEILRNHHKKILPQPTSTTAPATDAQVPARPVPAAAAIGEDPRTQAIVEEQLCCLEDTVHLWEESLDESNQNHLDENMKQRIDELIGRLQTMRGF